MKRELTVKDFAVGDVVVHHCSGCDHTGVLILITTTGGDCAALKGVVVYSDEPDWKIGDRQTWTKEYLTLLASPLALAKRYCGYKETEED